MPIKSVGGILALAIWASTNIADAQSLSEILDGVQSIGYSETSQFTLGDTLSSDDISKPLNRCLDFDAAKEIVLDTQGSTSSSISIRYVSRYEDVETELKYSYSVHANSSVSLADFGGGSSSIKNFGKFEAFLRNERTSAVLIIEAKANHGREAIRGFTYQKKYQDLIDAGDYAEFRKACGTHFIRGWSRQSSVRVIFRFSGLEETTKAIFENAIEATTKADLKVADIGGGGGLTTTSNLSTMLRLASKLSSIDVDVEATGGLGVESLLKIAKGMDYSDPESGLKGIFTELSVVSSDFKIQNSTPVSFIVVEHPVLSKISSPFDAKRFEGLGKIYKALLRVDQVLERYRSYERSNYDIWARYFRVPSEKVAALREDLVEAFRACKSGPDCEVDIPSDLDGLILEDVITVSEISGICAYGLKGEMVGLPDEGNLISSATVRAKGIIRFDEYVDIDGIEFWMLSPDLEFERLPIEYGKHFLIGEETDAGKVVYVDMFTGHFPRDIYSKGGKINTEAILEARGKVARSIFLARIPLVSGWIVEDVFGFPSLKDCGIRP